ncbi:MAG: ResB protein required for cytochrome c biosynthesis [Verrucomicrobiota bacterium]
MEKMLSKEERRKLSEERRARSVLWRMVYALGSLDLAILLLLSLAGVCAVATFLESGFSARVARAYVYNAPWFNVWLLLLALNLTCSAATRWPWEKKHAGFVITHAGILVLLAGALLGRSKGFEGSVDLLKGAPPSQEVLLDRPRLTVESPATGQLFSTPFDPEVRPPQPDRPRLLPLPGSEARLVIDGFTRRSHEKSVLAPDPAAGQPGLTLELIGPFGPDPISASLTLDSFPRLDLGNLAVLEFRKSLTQEPEKRPTFRETQMILARDPGHPILHNTAGISSGYRFFVGSREAGGPIELEILRPDGSGEVYQLSEILERTLVDPDGTQILAARYWPNLVLRDGQPATEGDRPENPAVLVMLEGSITDPTAPARLVLSPGPNPGTLLFRGQAGSENPVTGQVRVGETFSPGWRGWSARLMTWEPSARIETVTQPLPASDPRPGRPAVHARLRTADGKDGPARWIASGTSSILQAEGTASRIGFGLELQPLPFTVRLDSFEVPRDPGTEEPANFIASVTFAEEKKSLEVPAQLQMNQPATFPPGLWPQVTGLSYKFSQAGWDPQNLNRTTLQVLYDPGWMLKWTGSLLVVAGIFSMFYLRPPRSSET